MDRWDFKAELEEELTWEQMMDDLEKQLTGSCSHLGPTVKAYIWYQRGSKARLIGQPNKGGNRQDMFQNLCEISSIPNLQIMRDLYFLIY